MNKGIRATTYYLYYHSWALLGIAGTKKAVDRRGSYYNEER